MPRNAVSKHGTQAGQQTKTVQYLDLPAAKTVAMAVNSGRHTHARARERQIAAPIHARERKRDLRTRLSLFSLIIRVFSLPIIRRHPQDLVTPLGPDGSVKFSGTSPAHPQ